MEDDHRNREAGEWRNTGNLVSRCSLRYINTRNPRRHKFLIRREIYKSIQIAALHRALLPTLAARRPFFLGAFAWPRKRSAFSTESTPASFAGRPQKKSLGNHCDEIVVQKNVKGFEKIRNQSFGRFCDGTLMVEYYLFVCIII